VDLLEAAALWLPLALRESRSGADPACMADAIPWAIHASPDHTSSPRGRVRSVLELPGRALIDGAEWRRWRAQRPPP